jgi:hypothetical protein
MKLSAIIAISGLLAFPAYAEQQTPSQMAQEIIRTMPAVAYNPLDNSEEELLKASIANSRVRLQYLMASPDTPEETRICFALMLLEQRLQSLPESIDTDRKNRLLFIQKCLGQRLLEINNQQPNKGVQAIGDKSPQPDP